MTPGGGRGAYTQSSDDASALIATFRQERASRMPTRPLSALATDYPGIDVSAFASPADVNPANLTTFGLVANGVHYLGGCDTRAGPYPFCEALLVPSYSLAKSLVGGLGDPRAWNSCIQARCASLCLSTCRNAAAGMG